MHESYIGKDANVKLQFSHCEGAPHVDAAGDVLAARAADADPVIDVCDATCAYLPASSMLSELPLARASRGDVRCAHVREGWGLTLRRRQHVLLLRCQWWPERG